jgi:hypothetical protein
MREAWAREGRNPRTGEMLTRDQVKEINDNGSIYADDEAYDWL